MAAPLVSDELWALVEPLLPPRPPRPQGGRPPIPDRACFTGVVFFAPARRALRARGIQARIARRGVDSRARLGRHRWVVERTFAHLNHMRRLAVRSGKRADIHRAFLAPGCALLAFNHLTRPC